MLWEYVLDAVDADGDELTYTLVSGPDGMTLLGKTLSWAVTSEDIGEHPVSLKVEDGNGGEDTQDFVLVVKSV